MYYVYILTSQKSPKKYYIGFTDNLEKRLKKHNAKETYYAKRYSPWQLRTYISFKHKEKALSFEKYLKHGSGFAFLKRHLI